MARRSKSMAKAGAVGGNAQPPGCASPSLLPSRSDVADPLLLWIQRINPAPHGLKIMCLRFETAPAKNGSLAAWVMPSIRSAVHRTAVGGWRSSHRARSASRRSRQLSSIKSPPVPPAMPDRSTSMRQTV
jgi:hypothetical protein